MPVWELAHELQCWKDGKLERQDKSGRKHCRMLKDPEFNRRTADLHNLVPSIGEVNGDRSHFSFSLFEATGQYGDCKMKVRWMKPRGLVEPPERARGGIARIYLYMRTKYEFPLSVEQEKLFKSWDEKYPVTDWECQRDRRIAKHQDEHHQLVFARCQALGL